MLLSKTFFIYALTLFVFANSGAFSQSLSPQFIGSGGHYHEDKVSLSWTLGETMIQSFSYDTLWLTQGFQQAFIIATEPEDTGSTGQINEFPLKIILYPNPVERNLRFELQNPGKEGIYVKLFDSGGKLLLEKRFSQPVNQIDFKDYPSGYYFLSVRFHDKQKIFKIIRSK